MPALHISIRVDRKRYSAEIQERAYQTRFATSPMNANLSIHLDSP